MTLFILPPTCNTISPLLILRRSHLYSSHFPNTIYKPYWLTGDLTDPLQADPGTIRPLIPTRYGQEELFLCTHLEGRAIYPWSHIILETLSNVLTSIRLSLECFYRWCFNHLIQKMQSPAVMTARHNITITAGFRRPVQATFVDFTHWSCLKQSPQAAS